MVDQPILHPMLIKKGDEVCVGISQSHKSPPQSMLTVVGYALKVSGAGRLWYCSAQSTGAEQCSARPPYRVLHQRNHSDKYSQSQGTKRRNHIGQLLTARRRAA